jgi:hypothetical protein
VDDGSRRKYLSRRQLAGLVYVIIAIMMVGLATAESYVSFEWYASTYNLELHVSNVFFHLDGQPLGYPFVVVAALVHNPSGFDGITLAYANYSVFVNSTSQPFNVQGSSEVGMRDFPINQRIPQVGSLNLTKSFEILLDTKDQLSSFLNMTQSNLIYFVGVTLYFQSTFGRYSIPFCYELPSNMFTICPSPRVAP